MSPELLIAILAGVVLGASAHRAGLCTVKAVAEVVTSGRAHFLWSFLKAALWTAGFLSLAAASGDEVTLGHRPVLLVGLIGGVLFGLGAGLNGACSFSTLSRLAEGHLAMVFTLAGWAVAMTGVLNRLPGLHAAPELDTLPRLLAIPLSLWMVWEGWGIWRRRADILAGAKAGYLALSPAVLLLALANSTLLLGGTTWSFTSTALCSSGPLPLAPCQHVGLLWAVSSAALLTMLGSALWRGSFRIRRPRWKGGLRHFLGGLMMGAGAALIPGGNDGLILFGLPALSPHAFPTWAAIILGVGLSLTAMRRAGMHLPKISCEGDICRSAL
jgi:uncharacterized membrane protein YedE/YeeE